MRLRLWPRRTGAEPGAEDAAVEVPPELEPAAGLEPAPEPEPALRDDAEPASTPAAPEEDQLPAKVSLTLDEAKDAIRAAKGDVIQVGFLAGVYRRKQEDDPRSADTAAARAQLCEVIVKRLRDRKLLAPDGVFELREDP